LSNYLTRTDKREFLHPELQAELDFGLVNSMNTGQKDFLANAKLFWDRSEAWFEIEGEIVSLRDQMSKRDLPGSDELRVSADHELDYQYAMWRGDFESALDAGREVLSAIKHPKLQSYRTLWYYLAGCAAWFGCRDGDEKLKAIATDYFTQAQRSSVTVPWFRKLARQTGKRTAVEERDQRRLHSLRQAERLESVFEDLGTLHNRKFNAREGEVLAALASKDGAKFERGHELLGKMLGFESGNSSQDGAPDPWWIADSTDCLVFEDFAGASEGTVIPIKKARQVMSHPVWIRNNLDFDDGAHIDPVLVTPVIEVDESAFSILKDKYVWLLDDFNDWALRALGTIRELRRTFPGSGDLAWRAEAAEKIESAGIDVEGIRAYLKERTGSSVLKKIAKA
jgi:hypothetical protein